jgi:pimeloyl-ACP methyl ester carboxylesterase
MMENIVKLGHVNVEYTVEGKGPGLLLIHGTGGTYQNTWGDMIKALSNQYQIIAANYNDSDSGENLQLEDVVEQYVQLAIHEGIEQFHVVGYSLGAEIAAALAAKYPDRVKSLILIAGWVESNLAIAFQFDLWHKLYEADQTLFAQFLIHTGFSPNFYNNFSSLEVLLPMAQQFSGILAQGTGRHIELDTRINIRPILNNIVAPSLVIGLTHDHMVPVEHTKELASLIQGSHYREIASGHLVPWENGEVLINEVSQFLSSPL